MNLLSMRMRHKLWDWGLTALLVLTSIVVQTTILSNFPVHDVYCNLPLAVVIVWGCVFGSPLPAITPDELRLSSVGQVFARQAASGSVSGALVGALMAAFTAPMIPVFPFYLPFAGWVAGYFCMRNLRQQNLLCIPLVFVLTLIAETTMAWQLSLAGRSDVFGHLMQIAAWEAGLNAVIAPFIYFPLRRWYDFRHAVHPVES